jgi:hypothetical protein
MPEFEIGLRRDNKNFAVRGKLAGFENDISLHFSTNFLFFASSHGSSR